LPKIHNRAGNITALENNIHLPFEVKRVYYLYDVPAGEERGGHAHRELQQIVVAASGAFDVLLNDGTNKKIVHLDRPFIGLHIVPGIWRELLNFSSGAVCLVLASHKYDEKDYIRDYRDFLEYKKQ
jgi:dTDP-4-dehydrorhamnose 3,5-epimerase-like enzyme